MITLELVNVTETEIQSLALPDPDFLHYKPDLKLIEKLKKQFQAYKNILVVGHGGSVTTLMGLSGALKTEKKIYFLSSVDPDYIFSLKETLKREETLVIAISKSGETVTQIEALMHFLDYPLLFIAGKGSTLESIGKKMDAVIVEHPPIGGRYTGITEVALLPAAIAGLDVKEICQGAKSYYEKYESQNSALRASSVFFELEKKGFVDVFMPMYGHELFPFSNLIVQLCHESFGKNGVGQTYFAHEAPESQHHSNQRFFGGRKNVAGFFIKTENFHKDSLTQVPAVLQSLGIKDGSLHVLNKIPLSYAMHAEFQGTWEDAKIQGIPIASLSLSILEPSVVGEFIAFWQMFAVYSSVLRGVNPFDQPQVEASKKISWSKREIKFYGR